AEKYAKILAKTIVNPEGDASTYGQNAFFYDAAEGLLTAVILLLAEYLPPTEENPQEQRHIISVFKLVQDLLEPSKVKGKSQFQLLMNKLPGDHKARWFAGAALNSAEQAMASVMSTVLSRLNAFLDSELEQVLCFDSAIDAETFANEKSAIFLILPEEDQTKNFMAGLMIQNLSRELFSVADENGGKLKNRVVLFCDELGTMPPFDILPLFSAGRSRRLTLVPIIQSLAQLEKNYGREGSEIVQDNCQDTIFGGFAPNSQTAEVLSKAMGSRTVMSGSISRGKNDPSQSLQMMERPLMTPDELKSIPKGSFVVMKTGTHPMRTKLRLFLDWGIRFGEPYTVEEKANRKVAYADKQALEENIVRKHTACMLVDEETGEILEPPAGTGILHTPAAEPSENTMRRRSILKT
ncbi:MAG: type IV secretory system conjugative DNA transfer family protein, partial [Oscillospiraceae bacterium]|nr:type IV secretory system conjugative DNA transfer family protein [Oscillospiraceae bacterium]